MVVTFPLPFFLLHTTHSNWPGRPLAVGGTFSGKCLPVRRRGVVLLHLGQQIVLQGQQKEPQSPHLPVRVDLLPAQRENSHVWAFVRIVSTHYTKCTRSQWQCQSDGKKIITSQSDDWRSSSLPSGPIDLLLPCGGYTPQYTLASEPLPAHLLQTSISMTWLPWSHHGWWKS